MSKSNTTKAIVIKSKDISEGDRIVTFLSPDKGLFDAFCKGSRRFTSSTLGKFESFNLLNLLAVSGKSLDIVTQASLLCGFPNIRNSLEKSASALYLLDLINRYTEGEEDSRKLFQLLSQSLKALEDHIAPWLVKRMFEIKLISLLGYTPQLDKCIKCGLPGYHERINCIDGGVICVNCFNEKKNENSFDCIKVSTGALKLMMHLNRCSLSYLAKIKAGSLIPEEIRSVMDGYLACNLPGKKVETACYEKLQAL